ncbi:filamentous hemagglutinin N-terminal domain-containing protein [Burkholderia gladioli]|nr:filamentous hemagglutinin N-terminal domain-containing protein [Burkholderia gladioli]
MFVAVEETVHAPGRGNEGKSVVAARVPHLVARFALRQVAFAAWLAAGATPLTGKAQVAGSGAHAPSVIQTPNGLPQVNINKPGGGGVSLNTYSRFDVQKPGVIVNNSAVMTNTQQAGYINGNPNFGANDAARIIVNQVNSNNPSQLRGFIEIAGQRAEMIMSNPSGLVVDGGGFINTSRAILTTGTPNLNADGSLAGFNVTRGLIAVRGAGLDATNVDQVDLISRAIEANAAIHASTLNVVTGANRVDHDLLRATRIQGEGAAPAVAIDVGQLGGMYGNRIFLVGTEGGVGVRNAGTIAADAMGLTLNTDGRLTQAGKLSSLGNLVVSAVAGMENSGTTYAGQSASLDTSADVANAGALAAQHGVELRAGTLNSTGMLGSGVNGDGAVTQAGDLEVTTVGQLTATGLNIAGGKFSATGAGVNLAGGTTAAAGELSLRATTGDVNLANATTSAQGAATAKAAGTIANDHGVLTSSGSATLSGGTVSNQGGSVSSKGLLSVTAAEQIANQTGTLVSAGTMVLHGGKLANNQGTIQSEGHAIVEGATIDNTAGRIISLNADGLRLNTTGLLTNAAGAAGIGAQGGVITGNGDVTIQAASIRNTQGGQLSGANLQVLGTSLDNSGGRIGSVQDTNGDVDVTMNGAIANTGGQIGSNRDLTVKAATLQDGGAYKAARDAALSMQGDFSTTPDFQLNAGRNLVFTLSGTFSNGASIQAVNEVSIDAGNIVNRGTMMAGVGGNLTIASLQDMSSYGNNQHNAGGSGGFTLGPGGGGSIDASIGHTSIDSNYASVNQQTGIVAGKQGFDVEVAGHTQLNGAQIASVAPADHNTLTTNTLGFSDIQNRMSYSGSSEGISLSGGPSFAQTGDSASGVTHAAVSPAKIVVKSDQQNGTDSTAGLSRDTANANETVQSTFNLREVQNNLAFAHAFGKVATFALAEAATKLADSSPEMKTLFGEGGAGRDAMHAAVAAIGAALSGGNVGGAVAGSLAGDVLQSLAQPIVDQTVSQLPLSAQSAARNALNEIVATAGGAVGGALAGRGTSGALAGAGSAIGNEVYNRQLHEGNRADEKTLAKQLAVKSEGKYTQQQIEDQMRIMGGLIGGDRESGTPETLVGTMPTDSGAKWLYAGTTDDGKQILTQITVKPNAELQSYILANSAWAQDDVPSIMYDGAGKKSFGFEVTGPFTKFDPLDANYVKDTTADAAEAISVNAGRVSAAAGAAAAVPGPHSVAAVGLSVGAATVSLGASGVLQLVNPQPWGLGFDGFVDLAVFYESDRYPLAGPIFTEIGELIKNSAWANQIKTHLMESGGE